MTKQTSIPGCAPVEPYPKIRSCLDAWLAARDLAAEAKTTQQSAHDALLDAITTEGLASYAYDEDGKRKRVFPSVSDPKLKTQTVGSLEPKGRRGRTRDVKLPIDKERQAAVDALPQPYDAALNPYGDLDAGKGADVGEAVEHRKVPRASVVADEDPFAMTRGLLAEAEAKQKGVES